MPDLLLELFSEEIPARMQRQAAEDLKRLVTNALVERNLLYEGAHSFVTPRRLTLHVVGLPAAQPDLREERKGPRVGAPEAAIQGFLKSAGLKSIEDARVETDPKKGQFYVALIEKPGRDTKDAIAEIVPQIIRAFPWPKSMRWGAASVRPDALRWVRPLRGIVCTLAAQHETAEIVPFAIDGLKSGDVTWGHRFMAPAPIHVRRYDDYVDALQKAKVVLDADRRKAIILADAKDLAFAQGLTLVEDEGLLEEVAGLVEWPVVLMGEFEPAFLELPPEVIRATIRANQKCFVLRDSAGKLANKFILVSNLVARDGGAAIAAGNGRVVRARLADARHFWATDLASLPDAKDKTAKPLDQRLEKLDRVIFHEKLGTQGERIARIQTLAHELAPIVGANAERAARAAHLAKADLATEMVGEFPELQEIMGRYYAIAQGEQPSVADAIEDHYKPQGPNDRIPTAPVSIAVALADKLDTLVGFWAIDEKPTGSKDPYALRRAALGVIRILVENQLQFSLPTGISAARNRYQRRLPHDPTAETVADNDLVSFFADRLKVYLRDRGVRHDLIDAVYAKAPPADLLLIVRRVESLRQALEAPEGQDVLAQYRRSTSILRAEERKDGAGAFSGAHNPGLLTLPEEKALAAANTNAMAVVSKVVGNQGFDEALRALAGLRSPVDSFFVHVTVNDPNKELRENRLKLLNEMREMMHSIADFSKIVA